MIESQEIKTWIRYLWVPYFDKGGKNIQWRNRHREQTYKHGETGGQGEMYGKSNMDIYTTICKINSQQEFAVGLREFKQGLYINLKGWDGEGMGRRFKREGTYVYFWLILVRRKQQNSVKQLSFK